MANVDLITGREAAKILGVAEGTLRNWRWRNINLPYCVLANGNVRYKRDVVEDYARRRQEIVTTVEVENEERN